MKQKDFHSGALALMFATITIGGILTGWTTRNALELEKYKKLYVIEKAKADAADKVIDEVIDDWQSFYDSTGSGDSFWYYMELKELEAKQLEKK